MTVFVVVILDCTHPSQTRCRVFSADAQATAERWREANNGLLFEREVFQS